MIEQTKRRFVLLSLRLPDGHKFVRCASLLCATVQEYELFATIYASNQLLSSFDDDYNGGEDK